MTKLTRELFKFCSDLVRTHLGARLSLNNSFVGMSLALVHKGPPRDVIIGERIQVQGRCVETTDGEFLWWVARYLRLAAEAEGK